MGSLSEKEQEKAGWGRYFWTGWGLPLKAVLTGYLRWRSTEGGPCRALAPRPKILLCDEPLANLEHQLRDDLLGLIVEASKLAGSCLIYVTHDEYEATRVADTILRFRNGAIVG